MQMPKEHKPKLLILSPRFPFPLDKGDKLRLFHQIKRLSEAFKISLVALSDESVIDSSEEALEKYVHSMHILYQGSLRNPKAIIKSFFLNQAIQVSYYYQSSLQKKIDQIIEIESPDLMYVQLIRMAFYTKNSKVPCFIDYMDAMSLNMERESNYHKGLIRWIYKREHKLLSKAEIEKSENFEGKSIISDQDKAYLQKLGVSNLHVVQNGVDLDYFNQNNLKGVQRKYDIVFVGNMGYLPNVEAAEYLVNTVAKRNWSVLIAGSRPHKRVKRLENENIVVSGWVPDIRTAYLSGAIMVAPIFSGAGQQNKVLEAMALSKVCISTTQVAKGIGAEHNKTIIVADTPNEFQNQIETLLENPNLADSIGKNARIFVEENFHWDLQVEKLKKALLSVI